jgi:AbrB family looped-hinge helix DNA binding protein
LIPESVREALQLNGGDRLTVSHKEGKIEVIPLRSMQEMRGFLRGMDTNIERTADRL